MAEIPRFPPSFRIEEIKTDGATIHVRVGGEGPAVVMLHGFGDTGDIVGPPGSDAGARSHGRRSGFAGDGPLVSP